MTFLGKLGASLWFKIALGVVVGGAVLATILVFTIPGVLNGGSGENVEKSAFNLEDFLDQKFACATWNGTWLSSDIDITLTQSLKVPGLSDRILLIYGNQGCSWQFWLDGGDSTILYQNYYGDIFFYDVHTHNATGFIPGLFLAQYPGAATLVSPDQNFILIRYNESSVFRHSSTARYDLLDVNQRVLYQIHNGSFLQFAKFDSTGPGFAYVHENSLYYVSGPTNVGTPVAIAQGEKNVIYCGVPDWVYEEEVSGTDSAIWFSPDGKKVAYAVFNDTNVTDFSYFIYGQPGQLQDQYPTLNTIKYPKVGTPNPLVKTFVYDLETGQNTEFSLPSSINYNETNNDYILYDLSWISDTELAMISTNRVQNESITVHCQMNGTCTEEVSFKQFNGWLRPKIPHYVKSDGKPLFKIEILPQPEGTDYYDHLVFTNLSKNTSLRLTYGKRVVTEIYGYDSDKALVYYLSSVNNTPSQQHVFAVSAGSLTSDICLTCNWVIDGQDCKYARASFSKDLAHYVAICSGPQPHFVSIRSTSNNSEVLLWQNNSRVREEIKQKLLPKIVDLQVPVNGSFAARARMFLPPNLDESKKYPAIVNVYGGPESNNVLDSYTGTSILNHFVTNRSYIYIYIDGRGADKDGHNKMFQIYRRMGTVEIEDQISVTKYLQDTYPYIDANRTGIWGWSYGGFASTWALAKDTQKVFKFALAVAPVTSFIYYDTIYTERYMGLPTEEDNLSGYNGTDLTRNVEALRNRNYFIIHGNADDNVHYQQSMALVRALELSDIEFTQMSYPDENHSLGGVGPHLYHTLDKYFVSMFEE